MADTLSMTPAEREATYGSWSAVGKSKIIKCDDDRVAHAIGNWILKQGHSAGVGWDTYYGHRVMLDNEAQFIESAIDAVLEAGLVLLSITCKQAASFIYAHAAVYHSRAEIPQPVPFVWRECLPCCLCCL